MSSTEVGPPSYSLASVVSDPPADLKPENLLYLTSKPDSPLVLADFGIAKMLDSSDEVLTTMAGSFGYAAPEIMLKRGHGKPVDMWSLGVITYTLLCGYSPFRSESLPDLIDECRHGRIVFHERYWRDVSHDAKQFILRLLQPDPDRRARSDEALRDVWLTGTTATDHNLLPELRAYMAKARLRRGIEMIKLAKRIEALKMLGDDVGDKSGEVPTDAAENAADASARGAGNAAGNAAGAGAAASLKPKEKAGSRLSRTARSAIFREVVLAKVREMKEQKAHESHVSQSSGSGTGTGTGT